MNQKDYKAIALSIHVTDFISAELHDLFVNRLAGYFEKESKSCSCGHPIEYHYHHGCHSDIKKPKTCNCMLSKDHDFIVFDREQFLKLCGVTE